VASKSAAMWGSAGRPMAYPAATEQLVATELGIGVPRGNTPDKALATAPYYSGYDHDYGYAPYTGTAALTVWYWCDPNSRVFSTLARSWVVTDVPTPDLGRSRPLAPLFRSVWLFVRSSPPDQWLAKAE
jgi:hypothetical protein